LKKKKKEKRACHVERSEYQRRRRGVKTPNSACSTCAALAMRKGKPRKREGVTARPSINVLWGRKVGSSSRGEEKKEKDLELLLEEKEDRTCFSIRDFVLGENSVEERGTQPPLFCEKRPNQNKRGTS